MEKGGGSKGGVSKGGGSKGAEGWGARKVEAQNFALFFPVPPQQFVLFFPLWGASRGILVVFEAPVPWNVHVWSSRAVKCASPGGPTRPGRRGSHTTTRELQTRTFERPGPSNTTKIPREDPQRGKKRMNLNGGTGKKKTRNFGPPTLRDPTLSGPLNGPHLPPFGAPPFGAPLFLGLAPHPSAPTPPGPHQNKIGEMLVWSTKIGQIRQNKDGHMQPVNFGQMWYWPNSVWPNAAKSGV